MRKTCSLAKMQMLSKASTVYPIDWFLGVNIFVTDIENENIIPPLKLMTKSEVMNDLLKTSNLVQNIPIRKDVNIALTY